MGPANIPALLAALGIDAKQRGTKWLARCPDPKHEDRSPSWFIRDDPGEKTHGAHKCASCGFGGGPWELVQAVRGCTLVEAAALVRDLSAGAAPTDLPEVKVSVRRDHEYRMPPGFVHTPLPEWPAEFFDYATGRGITSEQVERWGIGYATTGPLKWRLCVPVVTAGKLRAYVARAIFRDGTPRYDMTVRVNGARPDMAVWGVPAWRPGPTAVICEGAFSGMSLERAGARNIAAILGSQFLDAKVLVMTSVLREAGCRTLFVCTDPDRAGDKAAAAIARSLGRLVEVVRVALPASPDDLGPDEIRAALSLAHVGRSRR